MILSFLLWGLIVCIAFSVGYAVRRVGICAVAAAGQSVLHRRHVRMRAFALTMCWSGTVLLPLAWLAPSVVHLSPGYPVTPFALLGGALFGAGAYVNGACTFGTLAHLSGGDSNYVGTLAGIFCGALLASAIGFGGTGIDPSPLSEPGILPLIVWLTFVGIVLAVARRAILRRPGKTVRQRIQRFGANMALLVIGIGGGLLYAVAGQWTYMSVLSHRAAQLVVPDGRGIPATVIFGALAVFAGGVFAAIHSGRFRVTSLRPPLAGRKFLGGTAMGFAAALIPGGNDVMLVYGLPSAAGHAMAAYAAMLAVLWFLFAIKARTGDRPRAP